MAGLDTLIDTLRRLLPPAGVVHVGAGSGATVPYAGWDVQRVVLVEADADYLPRLEAAAARPGWSAHAALIAERAGEADFHLASNPHESGLLPIERLTPWWPRLLARDPRPLAAITLDQLLAAQDAAESINWLVIDCLPAAPMLRGATALLSQCDAVLARVALQPGAPEGSGLQEVQALLESRGLRLAGVEEERHPALGRALFCRDWKAATQVGSRELAAARQALAEVQARLQRSEGWAAEIERARVAQTQLAEQRQLALGELAREREAEVAGLRAHLQQLEHERTEAARRAAELAAALQAAAAARDDQARMAAALESKAEQQAAMVTALRVELAKAQQSRDTHSQASAQLRGALEQARHDAESQVHLLAQHADEAAGLRLAAQQSAEQAAAQRRELEQRVQELDAREASVRAELDTERERSAAATALTTELQASLADAKSAAEQAAAEAEQLRQQAEGLRAANEQSTRERDEQAHWHQENAKWARSLDAEKKALLAQLETLRAELETARQQALAAEALRGEVETRLQSEMRAATDKAAAELADLRGQFATLTAGAEQLKKERDEQAHGHQQNAEWARSLGAEKTALLAQLETLRAELEAQRQRAVAAEASSGEVATRLQSEMRAATEKTATELADLRAQLDTLTATAEKLKKERDEQAHWHQENAKWARSLKAENETLKPELEAARKERAEASARADVAMREAERLSTEMQERDARQKLISAEMLRTEAQLELIKDVLLREKNF